MAMEYLAPELVLKVLEALSDPADVISAISASPVFLRIFNAYPRQIVKGVLSKDMGPEALHHALALAHFDSKSRIKHEKSNSEDTQVSVDQNDFTTQDTADDNRGPKPKGKPERRRFDFPIDTPSLVAMLDTHVRVMQFTRDYAEGVFGEFLSRCGYQGYGTSLRWGQVDLSTSERERFYRAFYRFELYCRLNPSVIPTPSAAAQLSVALRAEAGSLGCTQRSLLGGCINSEVRQRLCEYQLFVGQQFESWEVAELMCVHYYFCKIAKNSMDKVNRAFIEAVRTARDSIVEGAMSDEDSLYEPSEPPLCENCEENFIHCMCQDRESVFPGIFAMRPTRVMLQKATYLAMKGLAFMSRAKSANDDEDNDRCRVLLQANAPHTRNFLPELIEYLDRPKNSWGFYIDWDDSKAQAHDEFDLDGDNENSDYDSEDDEEWAGEAEHVDKANFAFRVYDGPKSVDSWTQLYGDLMVKTGLPFWDARRKSLKSMRRLNEDADVRRDNLDFDDEENIYQFDEFLVAEEYLWHDAIPREEFERILRDFV